MKFYNFRQNNSGGSFKVDSEVSVNVTIEAKNAKKANKKAKEVGIYFNGCQKGRDCSCCGNRWSKNYYEEVDNYSVFEFDGKEDAIKYFSEEFAKEKYYSVNRIIYFKDGTKESFDNGER